MIEKNNMTEFNIITGAPKEPYMQTVPKQLQDRVSEGYMAKKER